MVPLRKIKTLLAILLMSTIWSCKAQLPSFVTAGTISEEATTEEYLSWYSKTVKEPIFDTVTVFKMPDFSDLRYVIIRPNCIARIEYNTGRFIGWLSPERQWIETVKFDEKGRVVKGMNPIMISAIKEKGLIVQYERCTECVFKPNDKGKL